MVRSGRSSVRVKKIQPVNEIICEIVKQAEEQITNEQGFLDENRRKTSF